MPEKNTNYGKIWLEQLQATKGGRTFIGRKGFYGNIMSCTFFLFSSAT